MIRMSSLPIAQYCGAAHRLPNASGRHAAISSAFHAQCAGHPDASALLARLSDEERAMVAAWHKPKDCTVAGMRLRYEDAETEREVRLDKRGLTPESGTPNSEVCVGHIDMGWVRDLPDGRKCAVVADTKRSRYTADGGPDSLQVLAYGLAYAAEQKSDAFVTGIWAAVEGEWSWGAVRDMYSMQTAVILDRVLAAAQNDTGVYATGAHCRGCWQRFVCPAHVQRGLEGTQLDLTKLNEGNAAELLLKLQAAEDLVDKGLETLRDWVRVNGPVTAGRKVFGPVKTSRGEQFRWTNAK